MAQKLDPAAIEAEIARIRALGIAYLRREWTRLFKATPPAGLTKDLLGRIIAYRLQEQVFGGLDRETRKLLERLAQGKKPKDLPQRLKPGTVLVRDYQGTRHEVMIIREGFVWQGATYASLSGIARQITGTTWNGRRFFGIDRLAAPSVEAERRTPISAPSRCGKGIAASVKAHDANGASAAVVEGIAPPVAASDLALSGSLSAHRTRQGAGGTPSGARTSQRRAVAAKPTLPTGVIPRPRPGEEIGP